MSRMSFVRLVAVLPLLLPAESASAFIPTEDTIDFVNAVEGRRAVALADRFLALYGKTLAVDAVPGYYETTDDFVAAFVEDRASEFGVAAEDLVPDVFCTGNPEKRCATDNDCPTGATCHHRLDLRNGKFALYRYKQQMGGLDVHSSVLFVLVLLGTSEERIGYAAAFLLPTQTLPSENEITALDAFDVVEAAHPELTVPTSADDAVMVVFEAANGMFHRAWRFDGWNDTERYTFFVNTTTESIVGQLNQVFAFDGTVTVKAQQSLCCHPGRPDWPACCPSGEPGCCCEATDSEYPACADQCCGWDANDSALLPLSGAQVTLATATCSAADSAWCPAWTTDSDGVMSFTGANCEHPNECISDLCNSASKTAARLVGRNVRVLHTPVDANPQILACVSLGQQTEVDIAYPGSQANISELAAVNSFLSVQRTLDWILQLQPSFAGVDRVLTVIVGGVPASAEVRGTTIKVSKEAADFGGSATILTHEIGHFLSNTLDVNIGEDVADTLSILMWDTPCIAYNTRPLTHSNQCERHADPVQNERFPTAGFAGKLILAQTVWDLRKALLRCEGDTTLACSVHDDCDLGLCVNNECEGDGRSCQSDGECGHRGPCVDRLVEELYLDALPMFIPGGDAESSLRAAVLALLAVDDDDADMTSDPPTPHYDEIYQAFVVDHGFPNPLPPLSGDGSVKVKWTGPLTGDPSEGAGDFVVHYGFDPPIVELITTEVQSVPVEAWFVGRIVNGEPSDIGWVKRESTGGHDIIVQVGTVPEAPCRTAHIIDTALDPGETFSNIRLDLKGDLAARAKCFSYNGNGGRIEGSIAGDALGIEAEAIGSGAASGGVLDAGVLRKVRLQAISPAGASVENRSTMAARKATGTVDILGSTTGSILVEGDISGSIKVSGAMTGDIIADWDADGEGVISGLVDVTGAFTGNICDANMADTEQLASNITLGGGSQYTICALRGTILPPAPHTAAKNRYLSINPRTNYARELALKVRLDSMMRCEVDEAIPCDDAGDCPSGECEEHEDVNDEWWVAEPFDASCEDDSYNPLAGNPECTGVDFVARLSDTAVSLDWSAYPVLHIADCPIVPTATYAITAYDETAEEESTELLVSTIARPDSKFYGDVVGALTSNGWTPPQGVVNITDIQAVILGMQGVPTAPHRSWLDLFGPYEGCVPDFVIGASDLQAVVAAFGGANWLAGEYHLYPGDCPSTKTAIQPIGSAVAFSLDVSSGFIDPEEPVYVDVFIGSVDDLGAYEVALEVTGGTEGWLILTDITVDTQRSDYVFGASSSYIAANLAEARVGNVLASGGVSVTGPKYVATFTYQPSEGATGAFEFAVRDSSFSYLNDCDGRRLAVDAGTNEVIGVGLDCFVNGDCDDFNACTTDTCDDGACFYANVNQGTSCNDGLFCTAMDQCDGQGTCVGGMLTPCTEGQTCDEINDECVGLEQ